MKIDDIDKEFQALAVCLKDGEDAFQKGDMEQAQSLFEQAYATIRSFGQEHPDADGCTSRLAEVYFARRRYADATDLLLDLYQMRARQLGAGHPSLVQILFRTAKCFERQKYFDEAEDAYARTIGLINHLGIPDRPGAANIVESYARMLRSIEDRAEDAEDLESQARDLRDLSREKLNIEIIKRMSFGEDEALDSLETPSKSGMRSLRRRSGSDLLEPKAGQGTKKILVLVACLVLLSAGGSFVAVHLITERQAAEKKHAAQVAAVQAKKNAQPQSAEFLSADGVEKLILFDNGDATYLCGGENKKGTFADTAGSLHVHVTDGNETLKFQKQASGFTDQNGVIMYRPDAKELALIQAMKTIAANAQAAYHAGGDYIGSVPTYANPFTGQIQAPRITNIGSMSREVNFEKLERWRDQINQLLTWTQWSTGQPGLIDIYHYPSGDDGDTLYIKGTDAHGTYLRSTAPQSPYVIQLANGDLK